MSEDKLGGMDDREGEGRVWTPLSYDKELGGWVLLGHAVMDDDAIIRQEPGSSVVISGGSAAFFVYKECLVEEWKEPGMEEKDSVVDRWELDEPFEDKPFEDEPKTDFGSFADLLVERGMMNKPYNAVLTPSIESFLDVLFDKVGEGAAWREGVLFPPGVVEIGEKEVRNFRRLYMFDFVTQAQRWAETPRDMVIGSRYRNMLVLGSPDLPDGNFYVQYIIGGEDGSEGDSIDGYGDGVSPMSLAAGAFTHLLRHFMVSIYDYSNGNWPDGWYRIRKVAGPQSVDYVTPVRGGRIDNGRGAALLWMQNPPDGVPYLFERVHLLDEEQSGVVRDALRSVTLTSSDDLDSYWKGEEHWVNIYHILEQTLFSLSS